MILKYRPMNETESDGFESTLEQHGADMKDFEVSIREEEPDQSQAGGTHPTAGTVTVTYSRASITRKYKVGPGTGWLRDFELDLRADNFRREYS